MSPLPASSPTMPVAARRAFPSGRCCVRRRFRVYTGSDRCKRMASSNNSHDLGNVDGAGVRVFRRKQDRLRAAAVTNEQREEKNRKHRESYNKRKCYANDKENVPGLHLLEWTCLKLLQLEIPMLPTPALFLSYLKITLVKGS